MLNVRDWIRLAIPTSHCSRFMSKLEPVDDPTSRAPGSPAASLAPFSLPRRTDEYYRCKEVADKPYYKIIKGIIFKEVGLENTKRIKMWGKFTRSVSATVILLYVAH